MMHMDPYDMFDPTMRRDLRYAMHRSKEAADLYGHLMQMADCDDMAKRELQMCLQERMEEYQMLRHMHHMMGQDYDDCPEEYEEMEEEVCDAKSLERQPFVVGLAGAARREFDDDRFFRRRRFFRRFFRRFGFFGRGGRVIIIIAGRR